jgi:transposase
VISGIVYVLKTGCRWQDCPAAYGPSTRVYNRSRRPVATRYEKLAANFTAAVMPAALITWRT